MLSLPLSLTGKSCQLPSVFLFFLSCFRLPLLSSRNCNSSPVFSTLPGNSLCSWPHSQTQLVPPPSSCCFFTHFHPSHGLLLGNGLADTSAHPADTGFALVCCHCFVVRPLDFLPCPCSCLWLCAWVFFFFFFGASSSFSAAMSYHHHASHCLPFPFTLLSLSLSLSLPPPFFLIHFLHNSSSYYSYLTDSNQPRSQSQSQSSQ